MSQPIQWDTAQLAADGIEAKAAFRRGRLDEPLELYSKFFETFTKIFAELVPNLNDILHQGDAETISKLLKNDDRKTAFRYLAAPPISEDDLKVLADAKLSATALKSDPEAAKKVREIVLHIIDPNRFPWVHEKRTPSEEERMISIISSSAMVAAKKVETSRRGAAKDEQEEAVKTLLRRLGFEEVKPPKIIGLLADAPGPGQFSGERVLGPTRADIIIGLYDRRVLPIECKASNSEVNSYKRVNHEALGKAVKWLSAFGKNATVPAAVLSGVFGVNNLEAAQNSGLNIFWSHRLEDLADFIESTRSA